MLSMYGMSIGLDVTSNQRLTTARALRHAEEQNAADAAEVSEAIGPHSADEDVPTPAARQRQIQLRALAIVKASIQKRTPKMRKIFGGGSVDSSPDSMDLPDEPTLRGLSAR